MKIFCAYAFNGQDPKEVDERMRLVVDTLESFGHDVYCNLYDPETEGFSSTDQFLYDAIKKQDKYDTVFALVASEHRSEGQLMELGAAIARGKELVIGLHESAEGKTYLPTLTDKHFWWSNLQDLAGKLETHFSEV